MKDESYTAARECLEANVTHVQTRMTELEAMIAEAPRSLAFMRDTIRSYEAAIAALESKNPEITKH